MKAAGNGMKMDRMLRFLSSSNLHVMQCSCIASAGILSGYKESDFVSETFE